MLNLQRITPRMPQEPLQSACPPAALWKLFVTGRLYHLWLCVLLRPWQGTARGMHVHGLKHHRVSKAPGPEATPHKASQLPKATRLTQLHLC